MSHLAHTHASTSMRFFLRPHLAGRLSPGKQTLACPTVRILRHKLSKNTPSCQFWRLKIDFFLALKFVPQARGGLVFGPRNGPKKQACQIHNTHHYTPPCPHFLPCDLSHKLSLAKSCLYRPCVGTLGVFKQRSVAGSHVVCAYCAHCSFQ